MSTSDNTPDNPATPDPHTMNMADADAAAKAAAEAAASAPAGTDQATMKRMIREAIKDEMDERGVTGAQAIADASAAATIAQLEAHGAFNPQPDPAPATPPPATPDPAPATPDAGNAPPATTDTANAPDPAPATPDAPPVKKTYAERFLGGSTS